MKGTKKLKDKKKVRGEKVNQIIGTKVGGA